MKPFVAETERAKAKVVSLKERLKALKAADPKFKKKEEFQSKIRKQEKLARESQAKADSIEAAVFDLKAVNPNAVVKIDTRTPNEVIRSIEDQGKIAAKAIEKLKVFLQA